MSRQESPARMLWPRWRGCAAAFAALVAEPSPAGAHPHVFVGGGVDFVVGEDLTLRALQVTWHYDAFETLYMLAGRSLTMTRDGGLSETDRQTLVRDLGDWPADFDGSAHLSVDGVPVALDWPSGVDASVVDGRLEKAFIRTLPEPVPLPGRTLSVSFHERTYFFAFSVTRAPRVLGGGGRCATQVIPFERGTVTDEIAATLAALGREQTPQIDNVGALFADRIVLTCG